MKEDTYYPIAHAGFLLLTLVCLGFILWGIYLVLLRMGTERNKALKKTTVVGMVLGAWLVIVGILAQSGYFSDFSVMPPRLFPFLLIPLVAVLTLTFHPASSKVLRHVPSSWFMHLQVFRVPVEILLWLLFLDNLLPVQMTFEGRNWDVLTGLTAPVAAYLCYGHGRNNKWLAIVWNIAGLMLLVNIVSIAILSTPVPFRVFMNEPANTIVTYFPVVYLPTVLVPIAYAMHFFSLRKIFMSQKKEAPAGPQLTSEATKPYTA